MNGFKLLAIIPLKGCDSEFLNNLEIGQVYKFYQNYDIRCENDNTEIKLYPNKKENSEVNIYNLQNGIKVNISAIIGENGSGKSSLIELLFYFIYKIAILDSSEENRMIESCHTISIKKLNILQKLKDEIDIDASLYNTVKAQFELKYIDRSSFNTFLENNKITQAGYIDLIKKQLNNELRWQKKVAGSNQLLDNNIKDNLNLGIVFENENGIFFISYSGQKQKIVCLKNYNSKIKYKFSLSDFCYSISLNYSHHSLNNKVIGDWINSLFHKNDAYTTPLVINPMRDEGNFDVNKELKLNKERMMSVFTYQFAKNDNNKILNKYAVKEISFTVKKNIVPILCEGLEHRSVKLVRKNVSSFSSNIYRVLKENDYNQLYSILLIKKHLSLEKFDFNIPFLEYAVGYLENKITKLQKTYPQLFSYQNGEIDYNKFNTFLEEDTSHITKKIRQTLNYIKAVNQNAETVWESPTAYSVNYVKISDYKNWLQLNNKNYKNLSQKELMEFAMPGFFSVDYHLSTLGIKGNKFSKLSSGEQQMLFNINTVIYHLLNLQSIHSDKENRIAYKNVSIILDELELYYHPEMQRLLVKTLQSNLETFKTKEESGIESINICFLTHSPFILSDIPSSNILKLKDGLPIKNESETFGANIHDLLANDFFLNDGFMGEFAKEKIQDLINYLTFNKKEKVTKENKQAKIKWKKEDIPSFIGMIGEPLLRNSLFDLYRIKYKEKSYSELLKFYKGAKK